jgi:hypothetical protein
MLSQGFSTEIYTDSKKLFNSEGYYKDFAFRVFNPDYRNEALDEFKRNKEYIRGDNYFLTCEIGLDLCKMMLDDELRQQAFDIYNIVKGKIHKKQFTSCVRFFASSRGFDQFKKAIDVANHVKDGIDDYQFSKDFSRSLFDEIIDDRRGVEDKNMLLEALNNFIIPDALKNEITGRIHQNCEILSFDFLKMNKFKDMDKYVFEELKRMTCQSDNKSLVRTAMSVEAFINACPQYQKEDFSFQLQTIGQNNQHNQHNQHNELAYMETIMGIDSSGYFAMMSKSINEDQKKPHPKKHLEEYIKNSTLNVVTQNNLIRQINNRQLTDRDVQVIIFKIEHDENGVKINNENTLKDRYNQWIERFSFTLSANTHNGQPAPSCRPDNFAVSALVGFKSDGTEDLDSAARLFTDLADLTNVSLSINSANQHVQIKEETLKEQENSKKRADHLIKVLDMTTKLIDGLSRFSSEQVETKWTQSYKAKFSKQEPTSEDKVYCKALQQLIKNYKPDEKSIIIPVLESVVQKNFLGLDQKPTEDTIENAFTKNSEMMKELKYVDQDVNDYLNQCVKYALLKVNNHYKNQPSFTNHDFERIFKTVDSYKEKQQQEAEEGVKKLLSYEHYDDKGMLDQDGFNKEFDQAKALLSVYNDIKEIDEKYSIKTKEGEEKLKELTDKYTNDKDFSTAINIYVKNLKK